jgi:hypothetical protein
LGFIVSEVMAVSIELMVSVPPGTVMFRLAWYVPRK